MKKASLLIEAYKTFKHDEQLQEIYIDSKQLEYQRNRYISAIQKFIELYGDQEVEIYSAPGRSEIGGNHTDHQHGNVLAAAINLDAIAIVSKEKDSVKIVSDALDIHTIDLSDLSIKQQEIGKSEALVRGVLARFKELGYQIGGFRGFITSDVLMGSGLSSSASFEVLIGTILSGLYNQLEVDPVVIGQIGQYAENVYFGKPCGLMDQCASAVGNMIHIDFQDIEHPIVKKIEVDLTTFGYSLCIVDTLGSHDDLTKEYAAIILEMKEVANVCNKEFLGEVEEEEFYNHIKEIRKKCSDRAILRAHHFFTDNAIVKKEVSALQQGDFEYFKNCITNSGNSSFKFLQNIYSEHNTKNQAVGIGLGISEKILNSPKNGVCRVHGGGFAGTIQAFVKEEWVETYQKEIESIFGKGACYTLKVRKYGGMKVI